MKSTLINARAEILSLRKANELLSAKVEMIDLFACVLNTQPASKRVGESIDVAFELECLIRDIPDASK